VARQRAARGARPSKSRASDDARQASARRSSANPLASAWALLDSNQGEDEKEEVIPGICESGSGLATSWRQTRRRAQPFARPRCSRMAPSRRGRSRPPRPGVSPLAERGFDGATPGGVDGRSLTGREGALGEARSSRKIVMQDKGVGVFAGFPRLRLELAGGHLDWPPGPGAA
jgi:hypothetical protein